MPAIGEVEQKLHSIRSILISNKASERSHLNSQTVGPKGPRPGGAIIGCLVLALLSRSVLYGLTLPGTIFSAAWDAIIIYMVIMPAAIVLLFYSEMKHAAGFNSLEQLLDGPSRNRGGA